MRRGMVLVTVGAVALTAGGARFLVECRRSRSQSRSVFLQKTTRNWRLLSVLGSKLPSTGKDAYALSPIPTIFFEAEEITGAVNSVCTKPGALGISRTVEIDTTGGPGFGFEHFKQHDFLRDRRSRAHLRRRPLAEQHAGGAGGARRPLRQGDFFPIGKHATYYPEILKQVAAAGHTVGSHTWSHADLSQEDAGRGQGRNREGHQRGAVGARRPPEAPFFRFPALKHPPEMVTYLGERNIAIFSTDMDSFDFKMRKPEQVIKSVMDKLKKHGKGIVLMHDFQHATAEAMPELLDQLKANGYKIVHMKPRTAVKSLPEYDESDEGAEAPTVSQRPFHVERDVE